MKIDLKYYVNLIVAIAAIAIPSYITWNSTKAPEKQIPSLTISEKSRFQLENQKNYGGSQLDYYLNNQKILRFTTSIFSIVNTGQTPIESKDFIAPITITPSPRASIISASILSTDPLTLKPSFAWSKNGALVIDPTLLNPGDEITVALVSRPPEPSEGVTKLVTEESNPPSHLQWSARVKNMKDLTFRSFEEISKRQKVILLTEPTNTIEQLSDGWAIMLSTTSIIPFILITLLLFLFASQFLTPPIITTSIKTKEKIALFILFFTSISASEVIIFYVFHRSIVFLGIHYLNISVLALYFLLCVSLFFNKRYRENSAGS